MHYFGKKDTEEEKQAKKDKQFHEEVGQHLLPNEKIIQVIEMVDVDKVYLGEKTMVIKRRKLFEPNKGEIETIVIPRDKISSINIVTIPGTTTRTEVQIEYEGKTCSMLCTKKDSNAINFVETINKEIVKRKNKSLK